MKHLLVASAVLALTASTAFAHAPLTSPRPMPRPIDLTLPVKLTPCAIHMADGRTGFAWYDDGTVAGSGELPEARHPSALAAWAWIDIMKQSPSAVDMTFTPVCYD